MQMMSFESTTSLFFFWCSKNYVFSQMLEISRRFRRKMVLRQNAWHTNFRRIRRNKWDIGNDGRKYTISETSAISESWGKNPNIWRTPIILSHYFGISEICCVAKLKLGCEYQISPISARFCTGSQLWSLTIFRRIRRNSVQNQIKIENEYQISPNSAKNCGI